MDNTGVAMLIHSLQRKHGIHTKTQAFMIDSVQMDTHALFNGSYNGVFEGPFPNVSEFTVVGPVRYLRKTFTTASSTKFGVQAGQSVDLFMALLEGVDGVAVTTSAQAKRVAELAEAVYAAVLPVLHSITISFQAD